MKQVFTGFLMLILTSTGNAQEVNPERALYNYQVSCQGCHGPSGEGGAGVPRMQGFLGVFLRTQQGREFLVQVPGSANSALNDAMLAEVLNWMVEKFGGASKPQKFSPFTALEVAPLRKAPLNEVDRYRAQVLANIMRKSG